MIDKPYKNKIKIKFLKKIMKNNYNSFKLKSNFPLSAALPIEKAEAPAFNIALAFSKVLIELFPIKKISTFSEILLITFKSAEKTQDSLHPHVNNHNHSLRLILK